MLDDLRVEVRQPKDALTEFVIVNRLISKASRVWGGQRMRYVAC